MGQELFDEQDSLFLELVEIGSEVAGLSLKECMLNGPVETFHSSAVLQPSITAISLAYHNRLVETGLAPDVVMGHSLGEITALASAGVLTPHQTVEFAAFRGKEMDRSAALMGGGGMWAVLLGSAQEIAEALVAAGVQDELFMANDNAPTQTVIAGKKSAFEKFESYCENKLSVRFRDIPVSGPWHTPFIKPGRDAFAMWVKDKKLNDATIPFIMNGPAEVVSDASAIQTNITEQLIKPVYWRDSMAKVVELGVDEVYEVGPGTVLKGLLRANKIAKKVGKVFTIDSLEIIEKL